MIETTCSGTKTGKIGRKRGRAGLAAFSPLLLGAILSAAGQTAPLPKAESILDAFVEKSGGRAVFDKIVNRRTTSTMKLSVLPAPAEATAILTKAGPFRVVVNSQAIGKVEYGSDGRVVWEINPMFGPKIWEGMESKRFRFLYGLDLPMRWREVFKKVECTGLETVAEKPAFKVQAFSLDDYPVTYYFDQASGLIVKIEYPMETTTGQGLQEIILSDYRTVDGTLFPFLQIRRELGREMTLMFKSVEYNVDIPVGTLALPEAIRKISSLVPAAAGQPGASWRVDSTALTIEIDAVHGQLRGDARLYLTALGTGTEEIGLDLNRELFARSVTDQSGQPVEFERRGATLTVHPIGRAAAADPVVIRVQYAGSFSERDPEVGFYHAWVGSGISYGLSGRWYPELAGSSRRSRGSISYLVPQGWVVASVGRLTEEREVPSGRRFDFDITSPIEFSFAAGPFRYVRRHVDGLDVGVFLLGGGPGKPEFYLENCARIGGSLREFFGFFPYEGYSVVELPPDLLGNAGGGAWEGFTFYPSGVMPEGFFYAPAFAHEIGHLLWSCVRSADGPIISEGLAQVSMGLYLEQALGERTFRTLLKNGAQELLLVHSARLYFRSLQSPAHAGGTALGLILPGEDLALGVPVQGKWNTLHMLANSKGWFVYVMLRDLIGAEAFRAGLRGALARFAWKTMTLADLRGEFEKTSGRNLKWFFDQWFFRKGAPEFVLSYVAEAQDAGWVVEGRIRQVRDVYRVAAEIVFVKDGARETRVVEIGGEETVFSFVLSFRPDAVLFDPDYKILRWTDEFKK
ncbi:MAG: hypothetical protein MUQ00_09050 [Candidatus Aminicenantes bacterium]|nr:hypothetical protein [Candidatus Aminicenantes bacterium]